MKLLWRLFGFFRVFYLGVLYEHHLLNHHGCPWCGHEFEVYENLEVVNAGSVAGTPDHPAGHWIEGIQTCPRCDYKFPVSDSGP